MGLFSKATGLMFGKGGMVSGNLQSKDQLNYINSGVNRVGQHSNDLIDIGAQVGREGYNPYDAVGGAGYFDRMRNYLRDDSLSAQNRLKGSSMGRFSQGTQSALNSIRERYNRQMTDLDMNQLMTEAQFGQQGHENQMNALYRTLGHGNELALARTKENEAGNKPGLLQMGMGIYGAGKTMGMWG